MYVPPTGGNDPAYPMTQGGMPPIAQAFQGGLGGLSNLGGYGGLIPPMQQFQGASQNFLPSPLGQSGFMPPAMGGYWNQLAQRMAGPMYLPPAPPGMASPLNPPKPPPTYTPGPGAGVPSPASLPGSGINTALSRIAGGAGGGGIPSGSRTIQAFGSAPYIGSATTWGIDGSVPSSMPFMGPVGAPMHTAGGPFGTQVV